MKVNKKHQPALFFVTQLAVLGFLLSALSIYVWVKHNGAEYRHLAGKVVSVNDTEIILENRQGKQTMVIPNEELLIGSSSIQVGDFLRVYGTMIDSNTLQVEYLMPLESLNESSN